MPAGGAGARDQKRIGVDAYVGGRLWYNKVRIDVHVEKTTWRIDPVIGGRVRMDLSDRYFVRLTGDVGGFDCGSASKFTWQGWAMLGRRVKDNWTIEAGYRGLGIIREKSAAEADLIYHGPVFGATYRF